MRRRLTKNGKLDKRLGRERSNGAAEREGNVPLTLDRDELMAMLQECLTDFATGVGLKVACLLFDKQVDIGCEFGTSRKTDPGAAALSARKKRRRIQT